MKVLSIIKYLFTAIGFCLLAGAFLSYKNTQDFLADALVAEGVVIDLLRSRSNDSITYRPVVAFTTQSGSRAEFTSTSGSNPPSYSRGETVEVFYLASFPEKARINGFFSLWGAPAILGGIGIVFFLIGFLIILSGILKGKKLDDLRKNGMPIKANVQSVGMNRSIEVNGRNPFQIHAQWQHPSTSELHLFSSDNIWFDPTDHITSSEITVLIDRDNPKKYHVDISFLPKVAS